MDLVIIKFSIEKFMKQTKLINNLHYINLCDKNLYGFTNKLHKFFFFLV